MTEEFDTAKALDTIKESLLDAILASFDDNLKKLIDGGSIKQARKYWNEVVRPFKYPNMKELGGESVNTVVIRLVDENHAGVGFSSAQFTDGKPTYFLEVEGPHGSKFIPLIDILGGVWTGQRITTEMANKYENLEAANKEAQDMDDLSMALLYKAMYLNDMRLDKAEAIIRKAQQTKVK